MKVRMRITRMVEQEHGSDKTVRELTLSAASRTGQPLEPEIATSGSVTLTVFQDQAAGLKVGDEMVVSIDPAPAAAPAAPAK